MKFDCDKLADRAAANWKASQQWHTIFALRPRKVGPNDCRWLEPIQRRRVINGYWLGPYCRWEYRACPSAT